MHDPDQPAKADDLADKQRRDRAESRPLGHVARPQPLGQRPASAPLHRPLPPSDLVK